jgi:hypothetical protein
MRTKVLLGLAALAVGLSTSMAQVYSLNVVGYYNVSVKGNAAFTLCANQLNTGTNGIAQVIPTADFGAQVLTFVNNDYNIDVFDGTAWVDNNTGNPSTTTLQTGKGFFFASVAGAANKTLTFVGEVPQGAVNLPLPAGIALVGTTTPQALELSLANGFPQVFGAQVLYFDNTVSDYLIYVNDGTQWVDNNTGNPVTVIPAVGQGWFWQNAAASAWNRNFTVQ